jgi:hypothetical protein
MCLPVHGSHTVSGKDEWINGWINEHMELGIIIWKKSQCGHEDWNRVYFQKVCQRNLLGERNVKQRSEWIDGRSHINICWEALYTERTPNVKAKCMRRMVGVLETVRSKKLNEEWAKKKKKKRWG